MYHTYISFVVLIDGHYYICLRLIKKSADHKLNQHMTPVLTICILLSFIIYFYLRKKHLQQRFNRAVGMTVQYMFQERTGQYSGDRN